MAARATAPCPYRQSPPRRRRRRRRKSRIVCTAILYLLFAGLLFGALALCWKGMAVLWGGLENTLHFLTPDVPTASASDCTVGDREAPVLSGIHDFTIYAGDTVAYMNGISTADDTDPNPTVTVDSRSVDLSRPGTYSVIYTAADASGNAVQQQATVTVLEVPSYFVELDVIYAAADAKLKEIIRENATLRQQVHDIYAWARLNLHYGGHSDRTDWRQTAYVMLTEGQGDCYGYWAVTKLLLDRLEIPNMDVRKVKNFPEDTDHFWSLVSLDDGACWYHFDATPRIGEGDDFCLVTDAFLDAYSDSHNGSHNRDKSLYPPTP